MHAYDHSRARRLHRQHDVLGSIEAQEGIVKKAPRKWPIAAPASASDGKCSLASTRAHAVPTIRVANPIRPAVRPQSGSCSDSRFREASVACTAALEACPEGKLVAPEASGVCHQD